LQKPLVNWAPSGRTLFKPLVFNKQKPISLLFIKREREKEWTNIKWKSEKYLVDGLQKNLVHWAPYSKTFVRGPKALLCSKPLVKEQKTISLLFIKKKREREKECSNIKWKSEKIFDWWVAKTFVHWAPKGHLKVPYSKPLFGGLRPSFVKNPL